MFNSKVLQIADPTGAQFRLLGRSSARKRVVFLPPGPQVTNAAIAISGPDGNASLGFCIGALFATGGAQPVEFDVELHGSCVQDEWWCYTGSKGQLVSVIEVIACSCRAMAWLDSYMKGA